MDSHGSGDDASTDHPVLTHAPGGVPFDVTSPSPTQIKVLKGFFFDTVFALKIPHGEDVMEHVYSFMHREEQFKVQILSASGFLQKLDVVDAKKIKQHYEGKFRILGMTGSYIGRLGLKLATDMAISVVDEENQTISGGIGDSILIAEGTVKVAMGTNRSDFSLSDGSEVGQSSTQ